MKSQPAVKITQDDTNPVPVEVVAESIKAIAEGIRKLRAGPLNERALILLIQNAAPTINYQKISVTAVKAVLNGIESA